MIIKLLISLILNLLYILLPVNLPALPESVFSTMEEIATNIGTGISILRAFIGNDAMTLLAVLFGLVILLEVFYFGWSLVWFVIRKVPMLNVKE